MLLLVTRRGGGEGAARDDPITSGLDAGEPAGPAGGASQALERFTQATGHRRGPGGRGRGPVQPADHRVGRLGDAAGRRRGAVPGAVRSLAANELLDPAATGQAWSTPWAPRPSPHGRSSSPATATRSSRCPATAWAQLLLYRKDLFAAAGLPTRAPYADVTAAAKELNTDGVAGFVGRRRRRRVHPADLRARRAGQRLRAGRPGGRGHARQPRVRGGLRLLRRPDPQLLGAGRAGRRHHAGHLLRRPGRDDVLVAVPARRAGRAARRRRAQLPAVRGDPRFLAENTGIVPALRAGRARARPVRRGQSWAVPSTPTTEPAAQFVEFMMTDGYLDWLGLAPEGKFPARSGTPRGPSEVHRRVGDAAGRAWTRRRRWPRSTRRRCSTRWPAASTRSSAGASPGPGRAGRGDAGRAAGAAGGRGDHRGDRPGRGGEGVQAPTRPVRAAGLTAVTARARRGAARRRRRAAGSARVAQRDARRGQLLLAPTLIIVLVVVVLPILWTVVLAFQGLRLIDLRRRGCSARSRWTTSPAVFTSPGFWRRCAPRCSTRWWARCLDRLRPDRRRWRCAVVPRAHLVRGVDAAALRGAGGGGHVRLADDAEPAVRHRQRGRHRGAGLGRADPVPVPAGGPVRCSGSRSGAGGAADGDRVRGVALVPVRLPVPHRPAPGGAGRPRGGGAGGRGHGQPAASATWCCRSCCR